MSTPTNPPTVRRRRSWAIAAAVLAGAISVASGVPFSASPAGAANEIINPPSALTLEYNEGFGNFGDVPMPDCGSYNIEGRKGHAKWTIESSLGANSVVFPGTEWDITAKMYADNVDANPWSYNDGPDPLILQMVPTGPIERVSVHPTLPAGQGQWAYEGSDSVGPLNAIQTWGYAFDSNSMPELDGSYQEPSDGVDLMLRFHVRATAPGVIALPKLVISGWDSTPKAASVGCEVAINWTWGVTPTDPPQVKGETVKTDASYFADADERNDGVHDILIDVLANEDDLNTPGGVGNTDEVRIATHSLNSVQGGSVYCGQGLLDAPDFDDLFTGPCRYSPPQGYSGPDTFFYTVRQRSDGKESEGVVKINVVANPRPGTIEAQLWVPPNTDDTFSLANYLADPQGDPVTCLPGLIAEDTPLGAVTMNADCTFDWTSQAAGSGQQEFTYRVCDTHPLLANHGTNTARASNYNSGIESDLSENEGRRCTDGVAKLFVENALFLPPVAVPDHDLVDAWYSSEGTGPYSVQIPVLDDDFDPGDPDPTIADVLDGPEPSEGTAQAVGQEIRFTPAEGFSGPVQFTYRSCEGYHADPLDNLCGVGTITINVIGNEAPEAVDDWGVAIGSSVIADLDLSANDVEPDGEGLVCDTTLGAFSNPAAVVSASLTPDCLLDFDPADDATGQITFTYRVCDDHELSFPLWPADPYGGDGRNPGDPASRCDEALMTVTMLEPIIIDPEEVPQVDDGPEGDPDEPPVDPTTPPAGSTTPPPGDSGVVTPPTTAAAPGIATPDELPATGGSSTPLAAAALLLLGLGLVALRAARRQGTRA